MARSSDLPFPLSVLRDRSFQAAEVRRAIAVAGVYLVLSTVLIGAFWLEILQDLVEGSAPLLFVAEDIAPLRDAVPGLGDVLGRWIMVMLAVNLIVTTALGLYLSRRLGAPLLALKRTLRELGAGNLDVRLRASDSRDFAEIAETLEDTIASLRGQLAAAKREAATVELDGGTARPEDIEKALRNCRAALDYFQVDPTLAANDTDGDRRAA